VKKLLVFLFLVCGCLFAYGWLKDNQLPQPVPEKSAPPPEPGPPGQFNSKLPKFLELAEEAGVQIVAAREEKPGVVILTVVGRDNSEVSRYLSTVQANITLQDFESGPAGFMTTPQGKRRLQATFKFRYLIKR